MTEGSSSSTYGTVETFDEAVLARLRRLPVEVYDMLRPDDSNAPDTYVVFYGLDVVPGSARSHQTIAGPVGASVYHTFSVLVSATSPRAERSLVSTLRKVLVGFSIPGSTQAFETGELNSWGDADSTTKPVRYTSYITFQVTLERSA